MALLGRQKTNLPAVIAPSRTIFDASKNVINEVTVDGAIKINSTLGILDLALLDDFLSTPMGKGLIQGWRDYVIYVMGRSLT